MIMPGTRSGQGLHPWPSSSDQGLHPWLSSGGPIGRTGYTLGL